MFRFRFLFYLSFIIFLPLLFLGLPQTVLRSVRTSINQVSVPMLGFTQTLFQRVDDFFQVILDIWNVREENQNLKKETGELILELEQLRHLSHENQRLVDLLQFVMESSWNVMPARVIGRSPSQWNECIWIDRGSVDGVKRGMAVVQSQGVIGKVVETTDHASRVLLIIDPSCKVGAMNRRTQDMGILGGKGEALCVMDYIPLNSDTKVGDEIVSSGLSRFFPSGIPVGVVKKIQENEFGLFLNAVITPHVNFGKLREVLVVMSKDRNIPEDGE